MFGGFGNNGGNTQNNPGSAPSVNTRIRTFYSDLSCLQLSYWNENLSIRINPCIGVNEQGIRQYDYNRRGSTALTPDKCIALADKVKEIILPAIEEVKKSKTLKDTIRTGLGVGNKGSMFHIEYKNDQNGIPSLYCTLYTNIGQDNKAPKDGVYSYKFTKTTVVDNYDPESGTGTESTIEAEFMYFYEKLKSIADAQATAAHSVASASANKGMGGPKPFQGQSNGGFQPMNQPQQMGMGQQPPFGQPAQNNYTAPMSTFNSEDLPF